MLHAFEVFETYCTDEKMPINFNFHRVDVKSRYCEILFSEINISVMNFWAYLRNAINPSFFSDKNSEVPISSFKRSRSSQILFSYKNKKLELFCPKKNGKSNLPLNKSN